MKHLASKRNLWYLISVLLLTPGIVSLIFNGLEFAARGWNSLAIAGPGQGESLRLRDLYARHDYEG